MVVKYKYSVKKQKPGKNKLAKGKNGLAKGKIEKLEKRLDRELKNYIRISHQQWAQRYPKFRSNYQGDKTIGYNICKKHVNIPEQYYFFKKIRELRAEHIQKLDKDQFAMKGVLGHQGNRVLLIVRIPHDNDYLYKDVFRKKKNNKLMSLNELLEYAHRRLKDNAVILEEFLGNYQEDGIPPDYKVYVINNKVRIINLYFRNEPKQEASFSYKWKRIPLHKFYKRLDKLGYDEYPELDNSKFLPKPKTRRRLINIAEKLSRVHQAKFCRYDFYVVNDKIYLGEVTPVCGGLKNIPLGMAALKYLQVR